MKRFPPTAATDINRILSGASREMRDLLRLAYEQKFRISRTGSDHFKVMTPQHWKDQASAFAPKTPSDVRGLHRVRAKLRHLGVEIPHT